MAIIKHANHRARLKRAKKIDAAVLELMDRFEWCYRINQGDFTRMDELQRIYDNVVNESVWPTETRLPIPFLFSAVHEALPGAMDYLFPKSKWINLIPQDAADMDRAQNMEWALQLMLMHRMRLPWNMYPAIHSSFKVGIGYLAVEPYVVTPPQMYEAKAFSEGRVVRSSNLLAPGDPRVTLRCIDVNPCEIITSKDGRDFNGHKRVSHAFRFTSYTESGIKRLLSGNLDSEGVEARGNAKELIEEARTLGFTTSSSIQQDIARLGGVDTLNTSTTSRGNIPARVPVIKCYLEDRHVWIANGTTIIYEAANKLSTMMTPLVKITPNPDSDRWFPPSAIEVSVKPALGLNLWANLMFDIFAEVAKPAMVYNTAMTGGRRPERGPNGDFGVSGDPNAAVTYLRKPELDAGSFQMAEILQRWYGNSIGRQIGDVAPGMLRAGANAFEGVLQTQRGRERLANSIIEMGGIEEVVRITLMLMQSMGTEETFSMREWDQETGKEYIERVSITTEDLLGVYDVMLDLDQKHRVSSMDEQTRLAKFQTLSKNPYVDQYEALREFFADDYKFRRCVPSRERVAQLQEEQRQAQLQAVQQGAGRTNEPGTQLEAAAETAPQQVVPA